MKASLHRLSTLAMLLATSSCSLFQGRPAPAAPQTPPGRAAGAGAAGAPTTGGGGGAAAGAGGAAAPAGGGGGGGGGGTAGGGGGGGAAPNANAIKPYRDVVTTAATTDDGMFLVHRVGDKVLFEIPDSLIGREMLMISRWASVPSNFGGTNPAGFVSQEQIFTWERQANRILLRKHSYAQVADSASPISISVQANNLAPIVAQFPIQALRDGGGAVVIEVTDFYKGDTQAISGLDPAMRRTFGVRRLDPDRSFINSARSYPQNVEVRHTQTFEATTPPVDDYIGALTMEMNQSLVLLPKTPMRARYADDRVGYFSINRINFSIADQKAPDQTLIRRWRMEPKDPAAYARGELVEPVKPIVYYLDPATPNEYRSCVRQGILDWQPAFETAGFKNAIIPMDPPTATQDPDWNPEDVRYSVVRWAASLTRNAQGPSTSDPRTGEIIESDIVWYHNHLRSYRNRMMVETGAANPQARTLPIAESVMCETMRQVIAHELGHALGLPHNMIGSSSYPVDSLRSVTFTRKMGVSPSIMDYARQNYVAQPGDGLQGSDFIRRIGPYDRYAINWGYRVIPNAATPEDERHTLNKWIVEKANDPMYRFIQGAPSTADPRAQTEDIGDDPMKASTYGIMNLKKVLPKLIEWTTKPGEDYTDLTEIYGELDQSWVRYVGHVTGEFGGMTADLKTADQPGVVYNPVPKETQKRAMTFVTEQVFDAPTWMLDREIMGRIGGNGPVRIQQRQAAVLNQMLDSARLARMSEIELSHPTVAYMVSAFLDDIMTGVWGDAATTARDPYRRALQRAHVTRLTTVMKTGGNTDVRPLIRAQLVSIRASALSASSRSSGVAKAHLEDVAKLIDEALDPSP